MWSDAARASSMQARIGGQGSPVSSGGVGAAGNVTGGGNAIQGRLAQAGAASRGQWAKNTKGTRTKSTITGPAHQTGVNAITPNMDPPDYTHSPANYPNVASSSYGYGSNGMPGL